RDQHSRVQDRFTRTADQFAAFSLSARNVEAALLVQLAKPHFPPSISLALDVACGPGTFTLAFAPHAKWMLGVDLTPGIISKARAAAEKESLTHIQFLCADAESLPLPNASADLISCAYALHHMPNPARTLSEMARVLKKGGHVALIDLFVPEEPARADVNNRIEIARDSSHTRTLSISELRFSVEAAGFRILASEPAERPRLFDEWMAIAGVLPGTPAYQESRCLMEQGIPNDAAGFRSQSAGADISWVQSSYLLVARL
ncbi:MAG: class I SAM-dependent methyltransferase, partial [Acidobacteria bacterium]|nr:class I SAM-dependent methyltransferase [Acidobacteriota bacterium]